ncbi:hypothetical protein [Streptomyces cyslabdanicus]|uniref:hypothetical protein n=1 Tax=Streptomyces cyslabdanicus TaxID=1470456 RepID=UPI004043B0EF
MTIILATALLALTAAVVLLYAMLGELSSRLPAENEAAADQIRPLKDYRPGATAAAWPAGLLPLAGMERAVVLVLSPICTTCTKVAGELGQLPDGALGEAVGLVVSTGSRETGEAFVAEYALGRMPHLVDEGGSWVTGNFGVNSSPSALVFEEGVLTEAYTFGTVQAIREQFIGTILEGAH